MARLISFLVATTVSKTTPIKKLISEQTIRLLAKIAVGNLGTRPVFLNSMKIGTARPRPITNIMNATMLKNRSGRSSFINSAIVFNIWLPSLYVESLE